MRCVIVVHLYFVEPEDSVFVEATRFPLARKKYALVIHVSLETCKKTDA